tara:strand:- start:4439 stop:4594 length:156 start_codon:yes stop_codon:yes gene_type:complete
MRKELLKFLDDISEEEIMDDIIKYSNDGDIDMASMLIDIYHIKRLQNKNNK